MPQKIELYYYDPSFAAAVALAAAFGITTLTHAYQLARHRTWYFIPFVLGGVCETVGYGARAYSAQETQGEWSLVPFVLQSILILIAPALFAASIYMILGRIIRLVDGAAYSMIPIGKLTKIFVSADIVSFFTQAAGGGLLGSAKKEKTFKIGEYVIIGGLFVQLVAFSCFITVAGVFHWRIVRQPTQASRSSKAPWQRFLFVLYSVSSLILIRCIFRAIEYIQGYGGSLQSAEYWLYIFDAALMLLAVVILNIFHPSKIIRSRKYDKAESVGDE